MDAPNMHTMLDILSALRVAYADLPAATIAAIVPQLDPETAARVQAILTEFDQREAPRKAEIAQEGPPSQRRCWRSFPDCCIFSARSLSRRPACTSDLSSSTRREALAHALRRLACARSCTSILRVIPSPANPVKYPHFTTCVRGLCRGITPLFLPADVSGTPLALRHAALCLAK